MHLLLITKLTILLSIANGSPVLLKKVCGDWFCRPIDGGLTFYDGRRVLGRSKTIRGALASILLSAAAAPFLGLPLVAGALVGVAATAGDLLSSFLKRRLNFAPSSQAVGLDQIPEALFPLLACRSLLPLSGLDILIGVTVFTIAAILASPVFHRLGIRDQPF